MMDVNLPLLLMMITLALGLIYLVDILWWSKQRRLADGTVKSKPPFLIEQARSLFWVFVFVLLFRSFVGQQFRVPTGSLQPTVLPGDILLVSQFDYGLRMPVWHKKIISWGEPKVGDIVVIRWPVNPHENFIKRVIGVPGDKISYINKVLYINGVKASQRSLGEESARQDDGSMASMTRAEEKLPGKTHDIYLRADMNAQNFYDLEVPKGMYFMMGDNRDNSDDGRFWGFVPESYIVGHAVRIGVSWDSYTHKIRWDRFGRKI